MGSERGQRCSSNVPIGERYFVYWANDHLCHAYQPPLQATIPSDGEWPIEMVTGEAVRFVPQWHARNRSRGSTTGINEMTQSRLPEVFVAKRSGPSQMNRLDWERIFGLDDYANVSTRADHRLALQLVASTPNAPRFALRQRPVQTVLLNRATMTDAFGLVLSEPPLAGRFALWFIRWKKEVQTPTPTRSSISPVFACHVPPMVSELPLSGCSDQHRSFVGEKSSWGSVHFPGVSRLG